MAFTWNTHVRLLCWPLSQKFWQRWPKNSFCGSYLFSINGVSLDPGQTFQVNRITPHRVVWNQRFPVTPTRVLTRAREVIFIETLLILPPPPHLIPNTTNHGISADSGLFDGWGREATLHAIVLINGGLGWGCYSGTEGGCQWVYNIFKKLQTQSINKNINLQHTVSFGQVPWRVCNSLLTLAF